MPSAKTAAAENPIQEKNMTTGIIENVLIGIVSNALYSLLTTIFSDQQNTRAINSANNWIRADQEIKSILSTTATNIGRAYPLNTPKSDQVKKFFVSPDCEIIVRQIYTSQILKNAEKLQNEIKDSFVLSFCRALNSTSKQTKTLSLTLYENLVNACEKAVRLAISKGNLLSLEENSSIRHAALTEELQSINRKIELLNNSKIPSVAALEKFEEKYRAQVALRHGFISPPHLDSQRKLPIDDLYVTPTIIPRLKKKDSTPQPISLENFFHASTEPYCWAIRAVENRHSRQNSALN